MPPRLFRLEAERELAGIASRPAVALGASAGRQFKVLLSSRAPAQLSLALASPALGAKVPGPLDVQGERAARGR